MKVVKFTKGSKKAAPSFGSGEELTLLDLAKDREFLETADAMLQVFGTQKKTGGVGLKISPMAKGKIENVGAGGYSLLWSYSLGTGGPTTSWRNVLKSPIQTGTSEDLGGLTPPPSAAAVHK